MNTDSVPLSAASSSAVPARLKAAFVFSLGGLLVALRTIFLPYMAAAAVLFLWAFYAAHKVFLSALPEPFGWACGLLIFACYGLLALAYALAGALLSALRAAAVNIEDFLYELFAALKEKVRTKVNGMQDGVAKQQAKIILENSLREVFVPLKNLRFSSAPALAAAVFVSLLTFVSRAVFMARLARLPEAAVSFSAVFAGRATLVGALILNFRWLATLLLWFLYALGLGVFVFNLWLVW